jgi:MFS family permease
MGAAAAPQTQGPGPLTRDADFLKFWIGQTISVFGSQFSGLAIPYIATIALSAQPIQFGILGSLGNLAFLLFSLLVGVYVDRHRRRVIMIYADLGRASMLALIPLGYIFGFLSINLLYFVAFATGVLTVFFEISYQSYIPSLVGMSQLVDANGKLEATRAISGGAGPSIAGAVIAIVSAPLAVVGDTLGYLSSSVSLSLIRRSEAKIERRARSTWRDMKEGLGVVLGDRRLWQIAGCTSTANLFTGAIFAIAVPYLYYDFGYLSLQQGLLFSTAAIGSVLGALVAARMAARMGVGPSIILNAFLFGPPTVGLYIASGPLAPIPIAAALFITGYAAVAYNVNQVSYRQALVKRELLGRMNATMRFIVTGSVPIGAFVGGVLGQAFGYREAIGVCVIGVSLAFLWVLFSPLRGVKEMPQAVGS